jgi:hypothetical protein
MNQSLIVVLTFVLLLSTATRAVADDDILATLRPGHPRLIILDQDLPAIHQLIKNDPRAARFYAEFKSEAPAMTTQPVVKHVLIGPRLLSQSRAALKKITMLAAMYRLDGDAQLADRARDEMLAAAAFADWNPSHFLDVAEMTAAMAIGYDWLYQRLTPQERSTIRTAIVEKGLKQGLHGYETGAWWTKASHNWANVCAGGLTLGALAVADEEPDLARNILRATRGEMERALTTMAPDGGNPEGPAYWNYATQYTVYYLAACQSALGTDFGFKSMPGVAETGWFRVHTTGPLGKSFNYADAAEWAGQSPQMFWLARSFHTPAFAVHERQFASQWGEIFHLLWFDSAGDSMIATDAPLDALFHRVGVACFRGAWDDPKAFYVGFKGGSNKANHAHLDLGTFVLDAFGQRFATDLGPDDYNLPNYFGRDRWKYYRLRTQGHNTLTIDDENQDVAASAPIIGYFSSSQRAFAVADLTAGYPAATSIRRGVALLNRNQVIVQDDIKLKKSASIAWNMHTLAKTQIEPDGKTAILSLGGAKLAVRILAPPDAVLEINPVKIPPPQRPMKNLSKLQIKLSQPASAATIVVSLGAPDVVKAAVMPAPLDQWLIDGPVKDSE